MCTRDEDLLHAWSLTVTLSHNNPLPYTGHDRGLLWQRVTVKLQACNKSLSHVHISHR